jgi:ABC-type uncharacterized transport system substrate-binding protein
MRLEIRNAEGQAGRLAELAAELVASRSNVIVAFQTPAHGTNACEPRSSIGQPSAA